MLPKDLRKPDHELERALARDGAITPLVDGLARDLEELGGLFDRAEMLDDLGSTDVHARSKADFPGFAKPPFRLPV